jgi:hypothetical protein
MQETLKPSTPAEIADEKILEVAGQTVISDKKPRKSKHKRKKHKKI